MVLIFAAFVPFMYYTTTRSFSGEEPIALSSLVVSDVKFRFVPASDGTRLFVLGAVRNTSATDASRIWFRVNVVNESGKVTDSMLLQESGLVVPGGKSAPFRVADILSVPSSEVARTDVVVERARAAGKWD